MGGLTKQEVYARKNWSSFMLLRPDRIELTPYQVNNQTGAWLHAMLWAQDEAIGALPETWNWLEGWSDPNADPAVVHFTRGTPDMAGCEEAPYAEEWWSYTNGLV